MKQDTARPIATSLSKPEAIWRAIEELGYRTDVTEILEYVRKKYGVSADSPPPQAPAQVSPPPPAAAQPAVTKAVETQVAPKPADVSNAEPVRKPGSQKKPRGRNDSE